MLSAHGEAPTEKKKQTRTALPLVEKASPEGEKVVKIKKRGNGRGNDHNLPSSRKEPTSPLRGGVEKRHQAKIKTREIWVQRKRQGKRKFSEHAIRKNTPIYIGRGTKDQKKSIDSTKQLKRQKKKPPKAKKSTG